MKHFIHVQYVTLLRSQCRKKHDQMLPNPYNRRSTEEPGHSFWSVDRSTKSSRYSLVVQVPTLPNHDGLGTVLSWCAHVYEHKTLAFVQSGECINQTWPTDCFLNRQPIQNMLLYNLISSATAAFIFEDKIIIPIHQIQMCNLDLYQYSMYIIYGV